MLKQKFRAGIDIGSTTAKIAVVDNTNKIIYSEYRRHFTNIHGTIVTLLKNIQESIGDSILELRVTGSAGMGVNEKFHIPFIQEVVASAEVVNQMYPEVKTLIDIGGEDSKMIFFEDNKSPDIRMNGNCAGGTGAFIDQMASLMNIHVSELNEISKKHKTIYPIASRCGVFGKTDIQNLISRKISTADIAASIFFAVGIQAMNTLARGCTVKSKIIYTGGPFSFIPELAKTFTEILKFSEDDVIKFDNPELVPALGAAIDKSHETKEFIISELINDIENYKAPVIKNRKGRLPALFNGSENFKEWKENRKFHEIKETNIKDYNHNIAFLGIDSGSTTTKIVVTGVDNEILFKFYSNNKAEIIETAKNGLQLFYQECEKYSKDIEIKYTTATGYGEDLIKAAFGLDLGVVETIAHTFAAKYLNPKVSFVMDIGGQDMKAIFVKDGIITKIELNESCSSGCGSFIETFGKTLGYEVADFAELACTSEAPCDLGTRCTVFMNSKVKQSLRENATIADISAGLSISVIKNAIFKVLKLRDYDTLGDHIVVQGGTFRNKSVVRALEQLTGKTVISPSSPELMGAFGASLIAKQKYENTKSATLFRKQTVTNVNEFETKLLTCRACENLCTVTRFTFENKKHYFSGNKCEKVFTNKGGGDFIKGEDIFEFKRKLLFDRSMKANENLKKNITIGIPRVLNMFSNFPFWNTLLTECGIDVVISDVSTMDMYNTGQGTIMSDSICFPAKLVHGHVLNLIDKKVDRIFFPYVLYEKQFNKKDKGSFNCPIVSSYSEVIKSAIDPYKNHGIPVDAPPINFNDDKLLKKACVKYLKQFGISRKTVTSAIEKAVQEEELFYKKIYQKSKDIIEIGKNNDKFLVVLAGRPYHTDNLINHKTPQIFQELGVDVISEDSIEENFDSSKLKVLTQWAYPNKLYNSATWVSEQDYKTQFVQINSFGCGPDAIAIDECVDILTAKGKNNTIIRVDEITSTGSIKLRVRSFIESLKMNNGKLTTEVKRLDTAPFLEKDKHRTILAPYFAESYSELLASILKKAGYNFINLPKPDKESVNYGLKYSNNEICYPATIVVGDIIKALDSGKYKDDEIAIAITQTGGQCRASSYMSLIKKAMISAGYSHIPVVSFNGGTTENIQPGFKVNWLKIINHLLKSVIFADSINQMHNSLVVRETNAGDSKKIVEKYLVKADHVIQNEKSNKFYNLLEEAIKEFNLIPLSKIKRPKIGIVGEIYVKLNSYGHGHIVKWLQDNKIEVVVPPLIEFFSQAFVNADAYRDAHLERNSYKERTIYYLFEKRVNTVIKRGNKLMEEFKFNKPIPNIRHSATKAKQIISCVNQFGEGWLIPGEIADFSDSGINNVISVQPFGCIANQIISKGVEKKIKEVYPDMNLLFLDFDDGTSEVNILNRLHFMIKNLEST